MGKWRYSSSILDLWTRWTLVVSFTPSEEAPGSRAGTDAAKKRRNLAQPGIEHRHFSP
jgi:hypothetical protein